MKDRGKNDWRNPPFKSENFDRITILDSDDALEGHYYSIHCEDMSVHLTVSYLNSSISDELLLKQFAYYTEVLKAPLRKQWYF